MCNSIKHKRQNFYPIVTKNIDDGVQELGFGFPQTFLEI